MMYDHRRDRDVPASARQAAGRHRSSAPAARMARWRRDTEINHWFQKIYTDRYSIPPTYPAYHMAQSLLGLKLAWEKARPRPAQADRRRSRRRVRRASNSKVRAATSRWRSATATRVSPRPPTAPIASTRQKKEPEIVDIVRYPAECVNPPAGIDADKWLARGRHEGREVQLSERNYALALKRHCGGAVRAASPRRPALECQADVSVLTALRHPDRRPRLCGLSVHRRYRPDADLRRDEDPERHARLVLCLRRLWRRHRGRHLFRCRLAGRPAASCSCSSGHGDRPA